MVITLVCAGLYAGIVRPTSLAQRFVVAVMQHDFDRAGSMLRTRSDWVRIARPDGSEKADRIYAELQPREWGDVWNCRRRIRVTVSRHSEKSGAYVDWTEDSELIARPQGLEVVFPATLQINWPTTLPSEPAIINPGEGVRVEADLRTG